MADDKLLTTLINKLGDVLNGGDDFVKPPADSYITWCMPGFPLQAEDLQFAVKGISGKDGDETLQLIRTAADFSRLVNTIPSSDADSGDTHDKVYNQSGKTLWDIYNLALNQSEVASGELTDEQKAKIEKFRKLFVVKKKVKDIVTDEEKEVTEDSPIVKKYNDKMAAYSSAALIYNNKRLSALNADDRLSVQDFTLNADTYRMQVKNAMNDWVSNGYKNDVEKMQAYIMQVTQKDLTLLKAELQDKFAKGKMSSPQSGGDFYLSSFYPGNFVNSDQGWTEFSFNETNMDTYSRSSHSNSGLNLSGMCPTQWGIFTGGGGGGGGHDESKQTMDSTGFNMSFKLTQVPISRPWFSPEFLMNTAWQFKEGMGIEGPLCNGETPPAGMLTSYPTTAVFIKDVSMTSSSMSSVAQSLSVHAKGGVSIGWGPFRIGATHESSYGKISSHFNEKENTLTIKGMQMIAFKCFPMPKSPNPSSDITKWV